MTDESDSLPEGLSEDDLLLEVPASPPVPHPPTEAPGAPARAHSHTGLVDPHPHGRLPDHRELHAHHEAHHAPTWDEFVTGWQLGIYRDPILTGVLAGAALGALGVFIVLRRAVFVTAAVSQAAGLGVALVFFLSIRFGTDIPPVVGALVLAGLATASLALPWNRLRLPKESFLGFAFLTASALALLIGDRIAQDAHDIAAILFGTAVLVRPLDVALVVGIGALVTLVLAVTYRGLVFTGFDPQSARVHGLPVRALELVLWCLVALMVAVATRALGSLPVFAFAVLPAMTALACADRLGVALSLAALLGAAAGALGYLFAFFFEFPVGASQAAIVAAVFVLSLPIALLRRPGTSAPPS